MKKSLGFGLVLTLAAFAGCGDSGGKNSQLPRAPASNNAPGKVDENAAKSGRQEGSKPQTNLAPL